MDIAKHHRIVNVYTQVIDVIEEDIDTTSNICIIIKYGRMYKDRIKELGGTIPLNTEDILEALEHFHSNYPSPTLHTDFYNHPTFNKEDYSYDVREISAWWSNNTQGNEQRILFLKHLIKQLVKDVSKSNSL